MKFTEKVKENRKHIILYNYLFNNCKLSNEFLQIYNILLLIPLLTRDIINKIFNYYIIKEYERLKIFYGVHILYSFDVNYHIEIIKNNKINIIDKYLLQPLNSCFIESIFENLHNFNKDCKYIIIDIITKITYLDNANNLLDNRILRIIFLNKFLNEIIINNFLKIFDYNKLKKIVNKIPNDFLLIFAKNIIKNKINQEIFLILDYEKNTILHTILKTNGFISLQYIWKNLSSNIKKRILNHKNSKGFTINDMIIPNKKGKFTYLK